MKVVSQFELASASAGAKVRGSKMSPDHLVEYWSALDRQTVHPDDRATLSQLPHGQFAVDLQPLPGYGPLRSARVYILFLNPGLKPTDHEWERLPEVRKALRLNLKGDSPYLYLQSEFINRPGNEWTRRHFGRDIGDAQADKSASSNSLHTTLKTTRATR